MLRKPGFDSHHFFSMPFVLFAFLFCCGIDTDSVLQGSTRPVYILVHSVPKESDVARTLLLHPSLVAGSPGRPLPSE
ncbi:hypothetical protein B0H11DRAFT_2015639, partial [Mycena galericulata]